MIKATSGTNPFQTQFTDGEHECVADTTQANGGSHAGFRPHDLIEAALATCLNITVRMAAENRRIALDAVTSSVSLDRSQSDAVTMRFEIEIEGDLSTDERRYLLKAAAQCPVRRTLSSRITVVEA